MNRRLHRRKLFASALGVIFFCVSLPALAVPDVSGIYSGTFSGTETCPGPGGGPLSVNATASFAHSGATITGIAGANDPSDPSVIQFQGTVDNAGNVSGTLTGNTDVAPISGTFSGTFSNGTMNLLLSYTETAPPGCTFSISGGFTRTSSTLAVNPVITPGSIITTPQILGTQVRIITTDIQYRITDVLRAMQLRRLHFPQPQDRNDRDPDENVLSNPEHDEDILLTRSDSGLQYQYSVRPTASGIMAGSLSGMSAGDSPLLLGAWASYSYTNFENEFQPTAFDGDRHSGLAGVDVSPWENILFGAAVAYEANDIDTGFNLGHQQTDGFTIAPYFGALLTDTWSISASIGYSSLATDQYRTDTATNTRITSEPDHDRWFGMLNLNGLTTLGNWILTGQTGLLYARDEQDNIIESDGTAVSGLVTRLGQWNIGGETAYSFGAWEPFVRAIYEYDFRQTEIGVIARDQPAFDNDNVLFGVGLRYFGNGGLTGNLEFNTRLGRKDFNEYNLTATLRYDW